MKDIFRNSARAFCSLCLLYVAIDHVHSSEGQDAAEAGKAVASSGATLSRSSPVAVLGGLSYSNLMPVILEDGSSVYFWGECASLPSENQYPKKS